MLREKVSCGIRFADDVPGVVKFHSCGKRGDASSRGGVKSFTLIELLVVIAIIAILAAMLMPALHKARQAGQAASCQSNLKQQSVAVFAYADDYKGHYPVYDVNNAGLYAVVLNFCMGSRNNTLDEEHFNPKCGFYGSRAFYCPGKNNTYRQARYVD